MIRPTSDRILIEPVENETREGAIYVPPPKTTFGQRRLSDVQTTMGRVIAKGPGKYDRRGHRRPPDVAIGDLVSFSDSCGQEFEHEGRRYLIIREDDIMGVLAADVERIEVINE